MPVKTAASYVAAHRDQQFSGSVIGSGKTRLHPDAAALAINKIVAKAAGRSRTAIAMDKLPNTV
jgi:hypothetical protein